jgi:hypothetical protein
MSTDWTGKWTLLQPPFRVVDSAQRAFRERALPEACRLDLVFDSLADDDDPLATRYRALLFAGDGLDMLLTITRNARGNEVGGTVFTEIQPFVVGIRRPARATVTIPCARDGRMRPTALPAGTASVLTHAPEHGYEWQSDWLTL